MYSRKPELQQIDVGDLTVVQRRPGIRLLAAGSRMWTDSELIMNVISHYATQYYIEYLIHGNNGYDAMERSLDQYDNKASDMSAVRGADKLAGRAAIKLNIPVLRFPPDWQNNGRAAGPIRNRQMILNGYPTRAVIFHDDIYSSKGTRNMIELLTEYNIEYEVVSHE